MIDNHGIYKLQVYANKISVASVLHKLPLPYLKKAVHSLIGLGSVQCKSGLT